MGLNMEVGVIIFTILIWVSAWQLLPIIVDLCGDPITLYLIIILISIVFLYLLYERKEKLEND